MGKIMVDLLVMWSLTLWESTKRIAAGKMADFLEAPSFEEKVQVASAGVYVFMAAMCVLALVPRDRVTKLTQCVAVFFAVALTDVLAAHKGQPPVSAAAYVFGVFCTCQVVLLPGLLHACRLALGVLLQPLRLAASGQRAQSAEWLEQLKVHNAQQEVHNHMTAQMLVEVKALRAAMTVLATAAHRSGLRNESDAAHS